MRPEQALAVIQFEPGGPPLRAGWRQKRGADQCRYAADLLFRNAAHLERATDLPASAASRA